MSTQNPLVIPEILRNIFSYLPTTCLVQLTYVNKMWGLEARHKLYQNRGEIIYELHKWFLNIFRRNWGKSPIRFLKYDKFVANAIKFSNSFNLNSNAELLLVRDRLKAQSIVADAIFEARFKAEDAKLRARGRSEAEYEYEEDSRDRKIKLQEYFDIAHKKYDTERDLVNFEFYLMELGLITSRNEMDRISSKCATFEYYEYVEENIYSSFLNDFKNFAQP